VVHHREFKEHRDNSSKAVKKRKGDQEGATEKDDLKIRTKKATVGHKNFSFCEQTLHKGLIDTSCNCLQYTPKNRGQNNFLRKLRAKIQFLRLLFSLLRNISSYNPHKILKNARRGRLKIYIYFYLQKLQVGPGDVACRERQYATKNMARTNFLRKI
jgi:hypothetical protein